MKPTRAPHCTFLRLPPYYGMFVSHPQEKQLPLSMASCAALLEEQGWTVEVLDLWAKEEPQNLLLERLIGLDTDVFVVQVDSMNRDVMLDVIAQLKDRKEPPYRLVAMGQYADVFPEQLVGPSGPFDACVIGEPERSLAELLQIMKNGETYGRAQGVAWCEPVGRTFVRNEDRPLLDNPDDLPLPAYHLFDLDAYAKQSAFVPIHGPVRWGWILSSRGCPFGCLFCSPTLRKSHGKAYRVHSVERVLDMVETLVRDFGCNALAFEDDVFSLDKKRIKAICRGMIDRKLDVFWTAQTHLGTLDDELIECLYEAGCRGLCMGIESGDDALRDKIKGGSLPREKLLKNVSKLHETGINLTLYFMIGIPGETLEQMQKTLDLALELRPMMIQLAYFTPYPGSRAWDEYVSPEMEGSDVSHYNRFEINLTKVSTDDVRRFFRHFYRRFYLNPGFLWRYATRRLPYSIRQSEGKEWKLLFRAAMFFASPVTSFKRSKLWK